MKTTVRSYDDGKCNWAVTFLSAFFMLMIGFVLPVQASSELQVYNSDQKFDVFLNKLKEAIQTEKMGIVAEACADCGARSIGVDIPGNRVVMIFHPRFAVRMLKLNVEAGIEAPLRLYVTEQPTGTQLSFYLASDVFAPYVNSGELADMAIELDVILLRIANKAVR